MSECSFLSFAIQGNKIRWTDQAQADFKHRMRELTGRSWGVAMEHRLQKLGQYARGWTAYFGISQYDWPVPELDDWIRRRIRMCYWKQWRRPGATPLEGADRFIERADWLNRPLRTRTVGGVGAGS